MWIKVMNKNDIKERVKYLMCRGFNNGDIAYILGISRQEVYKFYPKEVKEK